MQIAKDTVVSLHYSLKNSQGKELESTEGDTPLLYLHGHGGIFPKLEEALTGKQAGDEIDITLTPEEAYGHKQPDSEQRVPAKYFPVPAKKLRPGMVVTLNSDNGPRPVTVIKVGRFAVDVDTNHPFAGETLSFHIRVDSVREATAEELAHGHAHGPGGHHHD